MSLLSRNRSRWRLFHVSLRVADTKNQWARDDPAFVAVLAWFLIVRLRREQRAAGWRVRVLRGRLVGPWRALGDVFAPVRAV